MVAPITAPKHAAATAARQNAFPAGGLALRRGALPSPPNGSRAEDSQ